MGQSTKRPLVDHRSRSPLVRSNRIRRLSDGLFLQSAREASARYPLVAYDELSLDTTVLQLVKNPGMLDVMVLPNLYGDIVSDLCAGLIGGLGLAPSGNIGVDRAIFESVRHRECLSINTHASSTTQSLLTCTTHTHALSGSR